VNYTRERFGLMSYVPGYEQVNGSWDGVIVRLRLVQMALEILFVGHVQSVFLSTKMPREGMSLGNGIHSWLMWLI
jgi:hypothetical protein